jgi:DNA-binding NarL/FixJ family response regulator
MGHDIGVAVTRIAVQDRQRLYREGIALVLGTEPDLEVVVTAASAAELVAGTAGETIGLVVLELEVDGWDACRLVAALRNRHPKLAVIGITAGAGDALPARAYQAGVRSVFPRNAGVRTLLRTIRSLPSPSRKVPTARIVNLDERRPLLSAREVEVLDEISAGGTTRHVAACMGISPKTVENHKQRIFSKLGVQNQAHAVAVAMRRGFLTPSSPSSPSFSSSRGPTLLHSA